MSITLLVVVRQHSVLPKYVHEQRLDIYISDWGYRYFRLHHTESQ